LGAYDYETHPIETAAHVDMLFKAKAVGSELRRLKHATNRPNFPPSFPLGIIFQQQQSTQHIGLRVLSLQVPPDVYMG
jgi:hypothetical protein